MQYKTFYGMKGIVLSDWNLATKHTRKTASHAIMMVGEHRQQIESLIQEEADKLVHKLSGYNEKPVDPHLDFKTSVTNIISALVNNI